MNYYERHIGDYLKDTAHLSLLEHGVYTRLLDVYYTREGGIPVADAARLIGARSREERTALAAVLSEFFKLVGDAHTQDRADREIERFHDKQRKAKASADARWSAQRSHTGSNANAFHNGDATAMRTHSEGNATRARPQSPVTRPNSEAIASGAGSQPDTADVIFGLGLPLLTAANVSDKNARSMLGMLRKQHGDEPVIDALQRCAEEKPMQPVPWLQAALKAKPPNGALSFRERDAIAKQKLVREMTGGLLEKKTLEVVDVPARLVG